MLDNSSTGIAKGRVPVLAEALLNTERQSESIVLFCAINTCFINITFMYKVYYYR